MINYLENPFSKINLALTRTIFWVLLDYCLKWYENEKIATARIRAWVLRATIWGTNHYTTVAALLIVETRCLSTIVCIARYNKNVSFLQIWRKKKLRYSSNQEKIWSLNMFKWTKCWKKLSIRLEELINL